MKTFELPSRDEKSEYVLEQFNRIAARYDLANDAISFGMHRLWKQAALAKLDIKPDGKYLDIATGTGDLALTLASRRGFSGTVTGLDFSDGMLQVARARSAKAGMPEETLKWLQGDAHNLPFPDNTFDGAIISFGLRNLTDIERGLAEMARVVKPGGKMVNLDLGRPTMPVFTPLFYFFFDNIVPLMGELIQNDRKAYTYLPESRKTYPPPAELAQLCAKAGWDSVQWRGLAGGSVALHSGTKMPLQSEL